MVCDYDGELTQIPDLSRFLDGYVCPKCGVIQAKVYHKIEKVEPTKKLSRWGLIKKRLDL